MRRSRILLLALVLPLVIGLIAQPARAAAGSGITIYVVPAMTDDWILPTTVVDASYISSDISVSACPGEYESASFVVRPNQEIGALTATASALSDPAGTIAASNIDIKLVKVWWQADAYWDSTWFHPWVRKGTARVLSPELLVKDPNFVLRGDERGIADQNNYIKKTDGTYYLISEDVLTNVADNPLTSVLPIKDSSTLLPVTIPTGTNQQFWVTIKVPAGQAAGTYTGTITLTTPSATVGTIDVELVVLPFTLETSMQESLVFPFMSLVADASATIGPAKSQTQIKAEFKDMYEHGVSIPGIHETNETKLRSMLQWLRDTGYTYETLYYYGLQYLMNVADSDATRLATLRSEVQRIVDIAADYDFTEVYFFGIDEAPASERNLERPNYEAVHEAGGKVFIDSYTGTYEAVGDIVDLVVWPYEPDATEAAKWHGVGHKIMCYGWPQSGVEAPETYRSNFGLLLWQRDYDGNHSFAYQWVGGGLIWSDFASSEYRSETFAYPTMNGVVDTIEWEGWREGVDDVRYLTTLLKTIEEAKAVGKDTSLAERWLAELKASDLATKDLGAVRSDMIGYILSFSVGSSSAVTK